MNTTIMISNCGGCEISSIDFVDFRENASQSLYVLMRKASWLELVPKNQVDMFRKCVRKRQSI